jgi:pyridoxal phosphate enzyme (YggS family)
VAVTKGHPVGAIQAALESGIRDIGENRIEALEERVPEVGRHHATWHMIGTLQSRKAARVLDVADWVHSVATEKLAGKISHAAEERGVRCRALVQVNTSGEGSKGGFSEDEAVEAIHRLIEMEGLQVDGLMTMAPFIDDEAVLRQAFARLREIRDRARTLDGFGAGELSMGMSNDYELAIEEGSTMIRLGTVLFGRRPA